MGEFQELQGLASEIGASRGRKARMLVREPNVREAPGGGAVPRRGARRVQAWQVDAGQRITRRRVLPTGVLPLTAVVTEVVHGEQARPSWISRVGAARSSFRSWSISSASPVIRQMSDS